jgi:hypothetical protein
MREFWGLYRTKLAVTEFVSQYLKLFKQKSTVTVLDL